MEEMMIDPICTAPTLDTTLFEQLTSTYFDINQFKPFLCEVMRLAGVDNIDPILYSPEPFDFASVVLNFAALTGVGDPRISLGYVLSAGFNEFFPLALAQVEVIRSGGCQVIDGYICDSDGNKRKEMTVYCPPAFTTVPITSQQIVTRTTQIINQGISDHAKRFSDYIKNLNFQGFSASLHYYKNYYMFYVKLTKGTETLYLKYYQDAALKVSENLGLIINYRTDSLFDNNDHYEAMIAQIPDY